MGIYGSCELLFVLDIYPEAEVEKLSVTGDVGLYAKYNGLFLKFDVKWSLVKGLGGTGEFLVYENGEWFPQFKKEATASFALYNALLDEKSYSVAMSNGENLGSVLSGIQNKQNDAYESTSPVTFKVGDLVYIVYYEDLSGYKSYDCYNYQKIVYQTYNTLTGEYKGELLTNENAQK